MRIPIAPHSVEIEVKKSRFIAIAQPISSLDEIKEHVTNTRKVHPQANHVVHAAVVGAQGDQWSASDDHEPKNTAGRPALEVVKGSGITYILVMIIRYFGGTLLGTGGLVKAYQEATKAVLHEVHTEELIEKVSLTITVGYDIYDQTKRVLTEMQSSTTEVFEDVITIQATVAATVAEHLKQVIGELSSGRARIL